MSESATKTNDDAESVGDQVECSKCGSPNPKSGHRCGDCGAHLYVRCFHCRERNVRSAVSCSACGKSMQATTLWRLKRTMRGDNARLIWLVPTVILFFVLGIVVASHFSSAPAIPPSSHPAAVAPKALTNEEVPAPFPVGR